MRRTLRVAVVVALAAMTAVAPAQAARRTSLAGNQLIEDVKDIFFFPHEVARYVNYVWFDFLTGISNPLGVGPGVGNPALGSGGILFGNANTNEFGFGIATHRADHQGALREAFTSFGDFYPLNRNSGAEDDEALFDAFGIDTLQWLDLLVGFSVTNELDLGARLAVGSNVLSTEDREGDDAGDPNPGTSATSVDVLLSGGYDTADDTLSFDFALELVFFDQTAESLVGADAVEDDGSSFAFGLGGRGFIEMSQDIDLGLLVSFEIRNKSAQFDENSPNRPPVCDDPAFTRDCEDTVSELGVLLGAGPIYSIGEEAIISAYMTLGVFQRTFDPVGASNVIDAVSWLLPGVRISAEWWLTDFFAFRSGLNSEYRLNSGEQQVDTGPGGSGGSDFKSRSLLFYWSTGVGFTALDGDFDFDAVINWPLITDGPYILSGNSNGMFAMVTAGYSF